MAEIHWLNPVDGNFDTASDWSGGVVPGQNDDAFLDASGTTPYTVTLTVGKYLNTLEIASTATLDIKAGLDPLYGVRTRARSSWGKEGLSERRAMVVV